MEPWWKTFHLMMSKYAKEKHKHNDYTSHLFHGAVDV